MLSPLALGYTGGQALSLMEAGTNGISAYMLGRLSRLFDVPLGAFYANTGILTQTARTPASFDEFKALWPEEAGLAEILWQMYSAYQERVRQPARAIARLSVGAEPE